MSLRNAPHKMPMLRLLIAALLLVLGAGFVLPARPAFAAPFTPGNIVVYRVGDGSGPLVNTGNPVFLDEYNPATGQLVQSIPLPTTANGPHRAFFASGTATSEGLLSRSADGRYLLLTGYSSRAGSSLSRTSSAALPRVVARVDFDGNIDTTTALTDFADGNNPRSATSDDGNRLWVAGAAGGVRATTIGATTSTQLNPDLTNTRQVAIFDGQLYVSSDRGTNTFKGVNAVGIGLPTTPDQPIFRLPGLTDANSPNTFGFFLADVSDFVPGIDTLYVANNSPGALTKFSLINGTWIALGTVGLPADSYRGLTGVVNDTSVTLYATRKGGSGAGGGGELVMITDNSGHGGIFTGEPTVIATAAPNTAFRGVALAPTPPSPNPETVITGRPTPLTDSTEATFEFTGSDDATPAGSLTFECSLDDEEFAPCTSPVTYTGLSLGVHLFRVRAVDTDTNVDPTPARVRWAVVTNQSYLPLMQR